MVVVDTSIIYPPEKNINNSYKNDDLIARRQSAQSPETMISSITSWSHRNTPNEKFLENKPDETLSSLKTSFTVKNDESKKKLIEEIENLKQVLTQTNRSDIGVNEVQLNLLQV